MIGASRTDSGVHALGNVAVFDTHTTIPPERISYALNQRLPEDIVIVKSEEVAEDFHPRYCDCSKTYEYHILNTRIPIPTKRLTNYFVSYDLDVEKMRKAAGYLIGEHDFVSFCNVRTDVEDTVRTVTELEILKDGEEITIRISGNGFLLKHTFYSYRISASIRPCGGAVTPAAFRSFASKISFTFSGS